MQLMHPKRCISVNRSTAVLLEMGIEQRVACKQQIHEECRVAAA